MVFLCVNRGFVPPIDAAGLVVTSGISCPIFGYAARCWYLGAWKYALVVSLVALIGLTILNACNTIVRNNNERAHQDRMSSHVWRGSPDPADTADRRSPESMPSLRLLARYRSAFGAGPCSARISRREPLIRPGGHLLPEYREKDV
jgi:hypothetical protein